MNIGLLGAARITPSALIHPARVQGNARIRAVAARNRDRAEAFAREHGIRQVLGSYTDLVSSPDIDLVYNPLPIDAHAQWSIAALEQGKHVLCEKPFAMNANEAARVQAAAAANGVRVIEAFHYHYHPLFQQLLAWVNQGAIGDITSIAARFTAAIPDDGREIRHRPEHGGGAMMDLGCYPLHWALSLLPGAVQVTRATATSTPSGVDEQMQVELAFAGGASASLFASMAPGQPFAAELLVTGSQGLIRCSNPLAPQLGASLVLEAAGTSTAANIDRRTSYSHQLNAVLHALEQDQPLATEGEPVLRQQAALDAVYQAAGLGHLRSPTDRV